MLRRMFSGLKSSFRGRRGQGITEYAAILAIVVAIAVFISSGNTSFKERVTGIYTTVGGQLQTLSNSIVGGGGGGTK